MQDLQMADPFGVVNAKAAIRHLLSHLSPSSAEWVQKSQYHLTWRITPPPDQIPFPIPAPLRQAGEKGGGRLMWIEVIGKFLHGVYARVFDANILAIKDFNVKPHKASHKWQYINMKKMLIGKVLATNLARLMAERPDLNTQIKVAKKSGIGQ